MRWAAESGSMEFCYWPKGVWTTPNLSLMVYSCAINTLTFPGMKSELLQHRGSTRRDKRVSILCTV